MTKTLSTAVKQYFNIRGRGNWGYVRYDTESGEFWADEYVDENSYTRYPEGIKTVNMNKVGMGLLYEFDLDMTVDNAIKYIAENLDWVISF